MEKDQKTKNNWATIVGKIDLSAFAPKKKTVQKDSTDSNKSEHKKSPKNIKKTKVKPFRGNAIDSEDANLTKIKDLWTTFVDVQEQLLNLRTAPITVLSESAKLLNDNLILTVDERLKTNTVIEEIATTFNLEPSSVDFDKGYIFVDRDVSKDVSFDNRIELSRSAKTGFVNFNPNPVLDGIVTKRTSSLKEIVKLCSSQKLDYQFDIKNRLQITPQDLEKLNSLITKKSFNLYLPDNASIIVNIKPNPAFFLSNVFSNNIISHRTTIRTITTEGKLEEKEAFKSFYRTIETVNGIFSDEQYNELRKLLKIELVGYELRFYVDQNLVESFLKRTSAHTLPDYDADRSCFPFFMNLKNGKSDSETIDELVFENKDDILTEEKDDYNIRLYRLKKFFYSHLGKENVKVEYSFLYEYDVHNFELNILPKLDYSKESFNSYIYNNINNKNITFSQSISALGIDYNWQKMSLDEAISKIFAGIPFLNFYIFKNHRINIDFKVNDYSLDDIESKLREKFPSIHTKRDDKNGTLYFSQEYTDPEQYQRIRDILQRELEEFNKDLFVAKLFEIPFNKEKYLIEFDNDSLYESISSSVSELRGAEFSIGNFSIGNLLRVKFPDLTFDISGIDIDTLKIHLDKKKHLQIIPNLTGDIEKVHRLKTSLNNIISGKNVQNKNLREFIFDSSKARIIEDIDLFTHPSNDGFKDIEDNLLNLNINESQKRAIIKSLHAKDLALIQGPPGTGKSTAIAEIIWQHVRKNPKERILLTSETNLAVDNAIDRIVNKNHNLVKPIRIGDDQKLEMEGRQFSVDFMKKWVETGSTQCPTGDEEESDDEENLLTQKMILINWIENILRRSDTIKLDKYAQLWHNYLSNPSAHLRKIFFDQYVKHCNLIGATCSSIGEKNSRGKLTGFGRAYKEIYGKSQDIKFTTVIQDEASKATPAELSLPLVFGQKNIIIGDHRQLPPMLDREEFISALDFSIARLQDRLQIQKIQRLKSFVIKNFHEMEVSHFERLFRNIDDSLKGIFGLQYRMHPDINDVIKQFYLNDGGLECGLVTPEDKGVNDPDMRNPFSRYHGIKIDGLISPENHVVWIDTNSPELLEGTSRINYGEVETIRFVLSKLQQSDSFKKYQSHWTNIEDQQIGLISFYGKQLKLLRNLRNDFKNIPLRISTVDRFQGMERNIIIVSMVRSNRIASDKNQKPDYSIYGELGFLEQKDLGFAKSPNRLNVALSRAKRLLIIVGNSELFSQKEIYSNVYKTILNNPNGRIIKYETK